MTRVAMRFRHEGPLPSTRKIRPVTACDFFPVYSLTGLAGLDAAVGPKTELVQVVQGTGQALARALDWVAVGQPVLSWPTAMGGYGELPATMAGQIRLTRAMTRISGGSGPLAATRASSSAYSSRWSAQR